MGWQQSSKFEQKNFTKGLSKTGNLSDPSDFFSRLRSMQEKIHACNFILYTINFIPNFPKHQCLVCELENYNSSEENIPNSVVEAYGDKLLLHFDRELLPIIWNDKQEKKISKSPAQFFVSLDGGVLPFFGVAFPVRLGLYGNGYVVFTADYLELANEMIIETHGACCQIMLDF